MEGLKKKKKNPANKLKIARSGEECNVNGCFFALAVNLINVQE